MGCSVGSIGGMEKGGREGGCGWDEPEGLGLLEEQKEQRKSASSLQPELGAGTQLREGRLGGDVLYNPQEVRMGEGRL